MSRPKLLLCIKYTVSLPIIKSVALVLPMVRLRVRVRVKVRVCKKKAVCRLGKVVSRTLGTQYINILLLIVWSPQ